MTETVDVKPALPEAPAVRPRLGQRLKTLLTQGHTPEKIALSIALGIALGLFPIFGTTTLLCIVVAIALKLNHPAIQIANQLMYLVQLPLIVVFIRLGESLLGAAPIPFSATLMAAELRANPSSLVQRFGMAGLHGILGWAVVAPIVAGVAYAIVLPLVRMASRRPHAPAEPASQPAAGA
jgi:uncharacterized protein (DUF2062 family)